jgi:hypothetical protein
MDQTGTAIKLDAWLFGQHVHFDAAKRGLNAGNQWQFSSCYFLGNYHKIVVITFAVFQLNIVGIDP